MQLGTIIATLIQFYTWLIIGYVLLSWIPAGGAVDDIRRALATLVDPYLDIFRRFIPPIGMIDISPIVAIIVLNVLSNLIIRLF